MCGNTVLKRDFSSKIREFKAGRIVIQCSGLYVPGFLGE
jgi:hypothetical protein